MEKIKFQTVSGTVVTIDDSNSSHDGANNYLPYHLAYFDGNSLGYRLDSSERVGYDGIGVYDYKANARAVTFTIGIITTDGSQAGIHIARRKLLSFFPGGVSGTITYTNYAGQSFQIEGRLTEIPLYEKQAGAFYTIRFALECSIPFWRVPAADVELTAPPGQTVTASFTSNTVVKVPAMLVVTPEGSLSGTDSHPGKIILSGSYYDDWDKISSSKIPLAYNKTATGELWLTHYFTSSQSLTIDWGLLGKFAISSGNYSYMDMIKSSKQWIYPGTNTLKIVNNATAGSIKTKIIRFDYVGGV